MHAFEPVFRLFRILVQSLMLYMLHMDFGLICTKYSDEWKSDDHRQAFVHRSGS